MGRICNPSCAYYPETYSKILKESIDKHGIKRREVVFLCDYDEHRITQFEECKNYKTVQEAYGTMLEAIALCNKEV